MKLLLQYSRARHWSNNYPEGAASIPKSHWKTLKTETIVLETVTLEDVERAMATLKSLVEETTYSGISEAFWRLVVEDDRARVVKFGSGSMTFDGGSRQISPAYKQGIDKVDVNDHTWSDEDAPGEEPLLDLLDKAPIPDGTVVQILDAWGEPVDTTEVV